MLRYVICSMHVASLRSQDKEIALVLDNRSNSSTRGKLQPFHSSRYVSCKLRVAPTPKKRYF